MHPGTSRRSEIRLSKRKEITYILLKSLGSCLMSKMSQNKITYSNEKKTVHSYVAASLNNPEDSREF